jgi:3-deoxy-7-phosphoheptulonate synthase
MGQMAGSLFPPCRPIDLPYSQVPFFSVSVAIDAMHSSSNPHAFMGVTEQGLASIVKTRGNKDVHVILRGGTKGPNYKSEDVKNAVKAIGRKREWASIMVDCSRQCFFLPSFVLLRPYHLLYLRFTDGNSQKNHNNQPLVVADICSQLAAGERNITGVMIESHINGGRQDVPDEGPQGLKHGVSITDACVDWEATVAMLDQLNEVCPSYTKAFGTGAHDFYPKQAVEKRRIALIEAGFKRPAGFERSLQEALS